jgi:hypothetical protein
LDLNNDGIKTLSIDVGVQFDLLAQGQPIRTGWISSSDGLLVLDRNGNQMVDDGSELFGSSTLLKNGAQASDGFAALNDLDSNHDGVINSDDISFQKLRVWVDSNSDGKSSVSEIKTLVELGIKELNLQTSLSDTRDNGNLLGLTASYKTSNGVDHAMSDVWLAIETQTNNIKTEVASKKTLSDFDLSTQVGQLSKAISDFTASEEFSNSENFKKLELTNSTIFSTSQLQTVAKMAYELERLARLENPEKVPLSFTSPAIEKTLINVGQNCVMAEFDDQNLKAKVMGKIQFRN